VTTSDNSLGADSGRNPSDSVSTPLDAVNDMRTTAKWILAVSGAVGAALISGGSLVAVGRIHGVLNSFLAFLGLVIALGGVALAIWHATQVLMPRLTTSRTLRESPALADLREQIAREPAEFFGLAAASLDGLFARQNSLRRNAVSLARQVAAAKDPARRAVIQAKLRQVEVNGERLGRYVRWILALGHAWQVKAALERSRRMTLLGGLAVIVGAVLFFSAAGDDKPEYVPVLTPAVTAVPTGTASPTAAP
jgi:hypothetical protein